MGKSGQLGKSHTDGDTFTASHQQQCQGDALGGIVQLGVSNQSVWNGGDGVQVFHSDLLRFFFEALEPLEISSMNVGMFRNF